VQQLEVDGQYSKHGSIDLVLKVIDQLKKIVVQRQSSFAGLFSPRADKHRLSLTAFKFIEKLDSLRAHPGLVKRSVTYKPKMGKIQIMEDLQDRLMDVRLDHPMMVVDSVFNDGTGVPGVPPTVMARVLGLSRLELKSRQSSGCSLSPWISFEGLEEGEDPLDSVFGSNPSSAMYPENQRMSTELVSLPLLNRFYKEGAHADLAYAESITRMIKSMDSWRLDDRGFMKMGNLPLFSFLLRSAPVRWLIGLLV